jgi:hypothetical protein
LDCLIWDCSAQRFTRQGEAVMALHQAVEHGVGDGGVTDPHMPVFNGQLADTNRRIQTTSPPNSATFSPTETTKQALTRTDIRFR